MSKLENEAIEARRSEWFELCDSRGWRCDWCGECLEPDDNFELDSVCGSCRCKWERLMEDD